MGEQEWEREREREKTLFIDSSDCEVIAIIRLFPQDDNKTFSVIITRRLDLFSVLSFSLVRILLFLSLSSSRNFFNHCRRVRCLFFCRLVRATVCFL